ncbi:unnamed protein product [Protopolystoma xenopodis]|uniref:V-type proton ATPase subunit G n=1 Tax=Protopolystoma xenopodis TaxID=117903 RepID=A0A448XFF7_9PLAT|nr:unnamed protein product [Protopolystoma xenopodis]
MSLHSLYALPPNLQMATRTDGIQLLLQAEKNAAEKLNEAKKRKEKRLKEAKKEAQAEIDTEKAAREREYKTLEEKVNFWTEI